jgi:hypothetical protein
MRLDHQGDGEAMVRVSFEDRGGDARQRLS